MDGWMDGWIDNPDCSVPRCTFQIKGLHGGHVAWLGTPRPALAFALLPCRLLHPPVHACVLLLS